MTVYSVPSGSDILGGRFAFLPSELTALVGDSLTAPSYELTTATIAGGVAGGVLRPVVNIGVQGETVGQILARINNSYLAGSPGLSGVAAALGVPKIGRVYLLAGTNDARALSGWSSISGAYTALVNACLTYADEVVVRTLPPICAPESNAASKDAAVQSINAGLLSTYGANPPGVIYLDGGAALRVGGLPSGAGIASNFVDGIHMVNAGVREMGLAEGDQLKTALQAKGYLYANPLVTNNADTYLSNPASAQWVNNPAMLGSTNISGAWSGQVVNGLSVGSQGSGGGTALIEAADALDTNQTPWQTVRPTAGQATGWTQITFATTGRAITSTDPARLEALMEVRFNALNVANIKRLTVIVRGNTTNNQYPLPPFWVGLGPQATTISRRLLLRSNLPRGAGVNESGLTYALAIEFQNTFTGENIGGVSLRCPSLRG